MVPNTLSDSQGVSENPWDLGENATIFPVTSKTTKILL